MSLEEFEALYGKTLPLSDSKAQKPYTSNNTLEDVSHTIVVKIIIWYASRLYKKAAKVEAEQEGMMLATIKEMPFYAMVTSGEGLISERMMEGIVELLNGHYIKGILKLFHEIL